MLDELFEVAANLRQHAAYWNRIASMQGANVAEARRRAVGYETLANRTLEHAAALAALSSDEQH